MSRTILPVRWGVQSRRSGRRRPRALTVVILAYVALASALIYLAAQPTERVATTRLIAVPAVGDPEVVARNGAQIASDPYTASRTLAALGESGSPDRLAERLHVDVPPSSSIVTISVSDPDRDTARRLVTTHADEVVTLERALASDAAITRRDELQGQVAALADGDPSRPGLIAALTQADLDVARAANHLALLGNVQVTTETALSGRALLIALGLALAVAIVAAFYFRDDVIHREGALVGIGLPVLPTLNDTDPVPSAGVLAGILLRRARTSRPILLAPVDHGPATPIAVEALASQLGRLGASPVLIDASGEKGTRPFVSLGQGAGLSEVAHGTAGIDGAMRTIEVAGGDDLAFLPYGSTTGIPSSVIGRVVSAVAADVERSRVIVALTPSPAFDSLPHLSSDLEPAAVLVVVLGRSHAGAVRDAVDVLNALEIPVVGILPVMN